MGELYMLFHAVERLSRLSDEEKTSEMGLDKQIEDMTKLLMALRSKLKNADPKKTNTLVQWLTPEIEEITCRIEDATDIHGLSMNTSSKLDRSCKRCFGLSSCLSRLYDSHASIKEELRELYRQVEHAYDVSYPRNVDKELREKDRGEYTYHLIVGREEESSQIIHLLMDESEHLKVISLWGFGGVGKTALARQVYNSPEIGYEFHNRIWVKISPAFSPRDTLLQALRQVSRFRREDLYNKSKAELVDLIIQGLTKGGRYLVVLDDVWSTQALDELQRIFLDDRLLEATNKKGPRILLTTRKRQVAEYGFVKPPIVYTVRGLKPEEAWALFSAAFEGLPSENNISENAIRWRRLVEGIEGLPTAILRLVYMLGTDESRRPEDIGVQESELIFYGLEQVLAPSFDDLPDHLKLCFIYLGIWPEGSEIDAEKLYHFWTVEDLVKLQDIRMGAAPLNVAEQYLAELADMSMVEVVEEEVPSVRRFRCCYIHRMMRLLSVSKGNLINFSRIIDSPLGPDTTPTSSRRKTTGRLFLRLNGTQNISILCKKGHARNLRSLHILGGGPAARLCGEFDFEEVKMLRLLDFDRVDFGCHKSSADGMSNVGLYRILDGISKLVHLRYLSFKRCFLHQLPSAIENLLYLQVLDLRVDDSIAEVTLPNVLWKMTKIKHLYLPRNFRTFDGEKLQLDGLTELETLDNFVTKVCNVTDLHTFTKLHSLAVTFDGDLTELQTINEHLKPPNRQIQLSIDARNFDCFVDTRHFVIMELLQYPAVGIFCLEGHVRELPSNNKISPSLFKIVLIGSELEKDPMEELSNLPNLRVLVLDNNAFEGKEMISPGLGFTELKRLEILNLQFLESWRVENTSMPKLCHLKIENCKKLRIPDGIKFLTALKKLDIASMPEQFADVHRVIDRRKANIL